VELVCSVETAGQTPWENWLTAQKEYEDIFQFFRILSSKKHYQIMPRANYYFMHNKLSPLFPLCYRFNSRI